MKKEKEIVGIIAEQLGVDEAKVLSAKNLVDDLGADSADMVSIIDAIEKGEGIEIKEIWVPLLIDVKNILKVINLIKEDREVQLREFLEEITKN